MGCGTCKGKKSDKVKNNGSDKGTNNLIDNSLQTGQFKGNFLLKLLALLILLITWPLITVVLFFIIIVNFFFIGKNGKRDGGKIVSDTFQRMVAKYGTRKEKRLMKRRKKELEGKGDYSDDSELLDIEVFETEENNKNDDEK